ncbi:MAG: rod shape-determining protein MreC [Fimbriimonadaceae bacterium]|nr:rod shape-determining protein MreC [Fimbriimonadaceae bacterium]
MKPKPYRDVIVVIVLCAVGVLLGRLQNSARNAGGLDFFTSSVQMAVRPGTIVFTSIADSVGSFFYGITHASSLTIENRRLKEIEARAAIYDEQTEYYRREIDRLRKDLSLTTFPGRTKIPTRIIGYSPYENRITLDKGTEAGIKAGLPILTPAGFVGVVQSADAKTSQALLISSRALQIGARIDRTPAVTGLLRGDSPGAMILDGIDYATTLQVGDLVMTSGFSDHIPRGIPIGRIIRIEDDEDNGSKRCIVFPNVQIGDVHEVFVIR